MDRPELSTVSLPVAHTGDAEVDLEVLKSVPKEFCIDSQERANWLVRKIVAARDYSERVRTWSEQEQRRAAREEQTLMFLFGRQIETWARAEIGKSNGRRKSMNLPAGSIGFRTLAPRLVIDDESVVLDWAKRNLPDAVVVTEKLSRSVIKEHAEKVGEIPDSGVHNEAASERFYIR